jgi:antitoxin MazE6
VKTAISIPDEAFRRVERHAARLHMSRSEFFARAADRWADELEKEDLTHAINAALELAGDGDQDDGAAFFHEAARRVFTRDDDS